MEAGSRCLINETNNDWIINNYLIFNGIYLITSGVNRPKSVLKLQLHKNPRKTNFFFKINDEFFGSFLDHLLERAVA